MHRCSHRAGNEAKTLSKKRRRREIEDKLHEDDDGGRAMMEMPLPETETKGGGLNDVQFGMGEGGPFKSRRAIRQSAMQK